MITLIKEITVVVGVHDDPHTKQGPADLPEAKLDAMVKEIAGVVQRYTHMDSYVSAEYRKSVGCKVNS